ncbi:MAG TPA: hypothetical protein VE641_18970 [Chthoniobacterales bacterium]|nr:hypothetical protein [Chthoniobacterales bacterium]
MMLLQFGTYAASRKTERLKSAPNAKFLEIGLNGAVFAKFLFDTREQPWDWRGAGMREMQRAVDEK